MIDRLEAGHVAGQHFVFMRGHRARIFTQGAGAWTARGVDIERVRPLLEWLRTKHGSVRAVADQLDIPENTVRGYMYKGSIQRIPGPTVMAIVDLVLAHRGEPHDPFATDWDRW